MESTPETQIEIEKETRQRHLVARAGYCLWQARLVKKLSLKEVSQATGLHEKLIKRMEGNEYYFNIRTIEPLIWFYGLNYCQVFGYGLAKPTHKELKELKTMQKQLNRYLKSKKRIEPQIGVQLKLEL